MHLKCPAKDFLSAAWINPIRASSMTENQIAQVLRVALWSAIRMSDCSIKPGEISEDPELLCGQLI